MALQFRPAFVAGTVHRDVAHALEEAVDARGIALARSDMTLDRLARRLPVFRIRHLPPRHRDDAAGTDDLTGTVAQEQGRQQLAVGEVAGAADDDQLERIDGNSLRGHSSPPGSASRRRVPCPAAPG